MNEMLSYIEAHPAMCPVAAYRVASRWWDNNMYGTAPHNGADQPQIAVRTSHVGQAT